MCFLEDVLWANQDMRLCFPLFNASHSSLKRGSSAWWKLLSHCILQPTPCFYLCCSGFQSSLGSFLKLWLHKEGRRWHYCYIAKQGFGILVVSTKRVGSFELFVNNEQAWCLSPWLYDFLNLLILRVQHLISELVFLLLAWHSRLTSSLFYYSVINVSTQFTKLICCLQLNQWNFPEGRFRTNPINDGTSSKPLLPC